MTAYLEPVNGAAVDERRKHTQAVAECVSDWTHGKHYMEIGFHSLNEVVVHRQRCCFYFPTLQNVNEA